MAGDQSEVNQLKDNKCSYFRVEDARSWKEMEELRDETDQKNHQPQTQS